VIARRYMLRPTFCVLFARDKLAAAKGRINLLRVLRDLRGAIRLQGRRVPKPS